MPITECFDAFAERYHANTPSQMTNILDLPLDILDLVEKKVKENRRQNYWKQQFSEGIVNTLGQGPFSIILTHGPELDPEEDDLTPVFICEFGCCSEDEYYADEVDSPRTPRGPPPLILCN